MDRDSSDTSERLQRALREVSQLEKQLQEVATVAGSAGDAQQLQAELATLRVAKTESCYGGTWGSQRISHLQVGGFHKWAPKWMVHEKTPGRMDEVRGFLHVTVE